MLVPLLLAAPALAQDGARRIAVKLREGSEAVLEDGELISRRADLAPLRRVLAARGVTRGALRRALGRSPAALRTEREIGERRSGRRLADLSLYFTLDVQPATDLAALIAELRALPVVESVEPWPRPAPPPVDLAPTTPDFTALQTYTAAAPGGIGSAALAGVPGADGAGTRYVDVEFSWQLGHEDLELPASALIPTTGAPVDWPQDQGSHGSAVLGILSARPNGYGVTGLVPAAEARVVPTFTSPPDPNAPDEWDVGYAIERAMVALHPAGPGDVILIEQQAWVCEYYGTNGSGSQLGAGPVEVFPLWYDVIESAAAQGVLVVEAAGNGGMNLDSPTCDGAFDRASDSGALIVSAGSAASHAPLPYSNYGSRIDLQGIGEGITTLGGLGAGSLFGGSDPLQRYQSNFGGSSSASALVAGVALAVQGMRLAHGLPPLEPLALRALLVQTGSPQAADPRLIGPLPDLAEAYAVGVSPPEVPVLPASGALALGALLVAVASLRARLR